MQGAMKQKPDWLNKKIRLQETLKLHKLFQMHNLHTVCKEALCPNIGECFSKKVATFLIMGNSCTRSCDFCAVKNGVPDKIDLDEPKRVAEAVKKLGLKHVVITSVTRDDIEDGGAAAFADTIMALKAVDKDLKVEVLVPDFKGSSSSIKKVIHGAPDIFAHNLETVPRLYSKVRQGAQYERSLDVLTKAKNFNKNIYTKSGLMLGLGETETEVLDVLSDLRRTGCDFLSLGQYLAPSKKHFPVRDFINPAKFTYYKNKALELGFLCVKSGSYVRSSYAADEYLNSRNVE
ncbi:MAG: lipoyl synthase [Candidatus Omnitrophica bacterium]|nr:lipoyl synthase [Candidatus Omnitrophota bacterium]